MMRFGILFIALVALTHRAEAQHATDLPSGEHSAPTAQTEPVADEAAEREWSFSLSAYTYIIPHDEDYVQPTVKVDRDWLHLEARYNYEDLDTGSMWVGYNMSFGDKLTLDFTPMIGGVFGNTEGVAPGYEITLAWRQFELYTEGDFLFDSQDSSDDFLYSCSDLTYAPFDWLRAGIAAQRTRIRAEDADIEVGPMIGVTYKQLDFSAYLLYPDDGDPSIVLGFSVEF